MSSRPQVSDTMQMILRTRAKALERETGGCRNARRPSEMGQSLPKPVYSPGCTTRRPALRSCLTRPPAEE